MKVVRAGRFTHPVSSRTARRYAENNLASMHSRMARLRAIAHRPDLGSSEETVHREDELLELARKHPSARGADWLLLRDYEGNERHRTILFFFGHDYAHPVAVMKLRRAGAHGRSLEHEATVLRAFERRAGGVLARTVPSVEDYQRDEHYELLVLGGLPGRPLSLLMQRSFRPRKQRAPLLIAAGEWLGRLHAATRRGDSVLVHGDFWPRNILFEDDSLSGVVDWEHGTLEGPPWEDLFTLPLLYATAAPAWRPHDYAQSFRRAFTEESPLGGTIAKYFTTYSTNAGIATATLRDAFNEYLAGQERKESGWQKRYPWSAMREAVATSDHSVFSG